jgi:hypothetical protein
MSEQANKHRRFDQFNVGDFVWLNPERLTLDTDRLKIPRSLVDKWIGPETTRAHRTFHISRLKRYFESTIPTTVTLSEPSGMTMTSSASSNKSITSSASDLVKVVPIESISELSCL